MDDYMVHVINCVLINNKARLDGGGIYPIGHDLITTSDSVISKNKAIKGSSGGIYMVATPLELNNTYIIGNHARRKGGGIYSTREDAYEPLTPKLDVKECRIVSNCARRGGGILNRANVNIDSDSIVSLNKSTNCAGC